MFKSTLNIFAIAAVSLVVFSSCHKKCKVGDDENGSGVIAESTVFCLSGYISNDVGITSHITENSIFSDRFQMSFNGGVTKTAVDYANYSILGMAITVDCAAKLYTTVEIDDINQIAYMRVQVEECPKCGEERLIEKFVLVRDIPDSYNIVYDIKRETVK